MIIYMDHQEEYVFGSNLTKYRKLRCLSQEQLSEMSNVSRRMIAHYETKESNPPVKNVLALARALDVSIYDLIGYREDKMIDMFKDVDPRTLKKIMAITKLSKKDRTTIYNMIDALLEKEQVN